MTKKYVIEMLKNEGYAEREFTSDELIEVLPSDLKIVNKEYHLSVDKINNSTYTSAYWDKNYESYIKFNVADSMFESLARLWIELKRDGTI